MVSWKGETKRTIRGLFTRGVTGVRMVMGEFVGGRGFSGWRNNENIGNGRPYQGVSCMINGL